MNSLKTVSYVITKNYKENWLILNTQTTALLKLGSDCITRFIQFAGTSSQVDSNTHFQNRQHEIHIEEDLKLLFIEVLRTVLPLKRRATRFVKLTNKLLKAKR